MNKDKHLLENLPKLDNRDIYGLVYDFYKNTEKVNFYDINAKVFTKKWDDFYKNEKIIIFVKYMFFDIEKILPNGDDLVFLWGSNNKEYIISLNKILEKSIKVLNCALELTESVPEMSEIISDLKQCLKLITFDNITRLNDSISLISSSDFMHFLGKIQFENAHEKLSLRNVYYNIISQLISRVKYIQHLLKKVDFKLLVGTRNNNPHMGLLFGFLKVYQHTENRINSLSKRHLDYYYKKVLNQKEFNAIADNVYLFFKLMPTQKSGFVAKESLVNAGEDVNGNSRYFKIDRNIDIHNTEISELRKIVFHSDKSIIPLSLKNMITDIYVEDIKIKDINSANNSWNLFDITNTQRHNGFGWVLATPFFKTSSLCEKFTVSFTFVTETVERCRNKFKELVLGSNLSVDELGYYFFKESILLKISTEDSWFQLDKFDVNYKMFLDNETNEISFTFELTNEMPKWSAFNKGIHNAGYNTLFPVLDFTLDESSAYFPYSLLKDLVINEIHLEVEVNKHSNPLVFNKHGKVDVTSPFPIFGVNPIKGNYFELKVPEWEHQHVKEVSFYIEWYDIFQPNLTTYYKGYTNEELKDENFIVSFDSYELALFSLSSDNKIQPETVWEKLVLKKGLSKKNISINSNNFLRVILCFPDVGFGHMIYMDEILKYNEKLLNFRKKKVIPPIVKAPYTPIVKSLKVSYVANQFIDLESKDNPFYDFIHKHPLGYEHVGSQNKNNLLQLLPIEEPSASLFIGLYKVKKNTSITLYFNIKYIGCVLERRTVSILYLLGSVWKLMPIDHIVQNTTEDFTISGILEIIIPEDIQSNHQWLDKNKEWIRFTTSSDLTFLRTCYHIDTNVGLASRIMDDNMESIFPIPTGTITELVVKNQKVQQIIQPFPSFGGKCKETEIDLYKRVSHVLRHKNRAVRVQDFYNLVMDNFPEVIHVKCLTPVLYQEKVNKGQVHIVVVYDVDGNYNHTFSPLELNKKIKSFLQEKCLIGVNIQVYNPDIELIEVIINVKIKKSIGFPKKSIQKRIDSFIAPWLYGMNKDENHFKAQLTISGLIKRVCEEPGVLGVNNCTVIQIKGVNKKYKYLESKNNDEVIMPFSPINMFFPSKNHQINSCKEKENKSIGVGNMVIGQDFILQEKTQKKVQDKIQEVKNTTETNNIIIKKIDLNNF